GPPATALPAVMAKKRILVLAGNRELDPAVAHVVRDTDPFDEPRHQRAFLRSSVPSAIASPSGVPSGDYSTAPSRKSTRAEVVSMRTGALWGKARLAVP